jgi:T-complex protein 1 subunit eta
MHSQVVIKGFREAMKVAVERIKEVSVKIGDKGAEEKRELLKKCAQTSLNSKIISKYKDFFSEMVVNAVEHLE